MLTFAVPQIVNGQMLAADLAAAGLPSRVALNGGNVELVDLAEGDRAAAQPVVDGHAAKASAEATRLSTERTNADSIQAAATSALADNRTFLAIASPTAAQSTAQVKALTRQMNGVIRLLLGHFDGTD